MSNLNSSLNHVIFNYTSYLSAIATMKDFSVLTKSKVKMQVRTMFATTV